MTIEPNKIYVVVYHKTYKHKGKTYNVQILLTGFFDVKAAEENEPFFIGATFGKLKGRKLPYCDLTELDRWEFMETCTIISVIGDVL
jgi:hypothetical protein